MRVKLWASRIHDITAALHRDALEIENVLVWTELTNDQFGLCALWYRDIAVPGDHVLSDPAVIDPTTIPARNINGRIRTDCDPGAWGDRIGERRNTTAGEKCGNCE